MGTLNIDGKTYTLTLAVGPSSGSGPVQEVTFSGSVTLLYDLETGTNLQFVTRASSPEAQYIDELATDVWLLGDLMHARFRSWAVWQEWYENGQDNVACMAVTYKKLLNRRHVVDYTGLDFTDVDLGDIIWTLWAHTQLVPGGDLGITRGTPSTTGLLRTRSYKVGENLGQLAEEEYDEGIVWDIDENLVFTCDLAENGPWIAPPLHLGTNVRSMLRASGSDFANAVFGDADKETTIGVWVEDASVTTDPRGRWELATGWPTVKLQDTLVERTNAFAKTTLTPVAHWNLDMEPGRWVTDSKVMPGMFAVLVVPRSLAAPLGEPTPTIVVQIISLSFNYDEDGRVTIKAVANERPDITPPARR